MNTDDIELLAAAPATAYREYLYRPHGELARWIGARFDIVARPGQPISQALRAGDVLLQVTLGRLGSGRCLVLRADDGELAGSPRRLPTGQLLLRPRRRAEMSDPRPVEPTVAAVAAEMGLRPTADTADDVAVEHEFGEYDPEDRTPVPVDTAAAPAPTAALSALEGRYFPPTGGPDVAPISRLGSVTPLIDGVTYFAAIKTEIDQLHAGDIWYVTAWWLDPGFRFAPGGPTLLQLLTAKAAAGVDVRVILWANRNLLAFPQVVTALNLGGYLAVSQGNVAAAEALRAVPGPAGGTPLAGRVLLDWSGHVASSHHMKLTVLSRQGSLIAFAGGIDYRQDRMDGPPHATLFRRRDGSVFRWGWHDAGVRVSGDYAQRMLDTFTTRWQEAATLSPATYDIGAGSPPLNPLPIVVLATSAFTAAGPPSTDTSAQVIRSIPDLKQANPSPFTRDVPWSIWPADGVHEVRRTLLTALAAAQRYIYIEDQAFDATGTLFPALVAACKRGVRVIAVVPGSLDPNDGTVGPANGTLSSAVTSGLLAHLTPAEQQNLAVWRLDGITVHSKLILIDDEFLADGSANFMDRSMQFTGMQGDDSELSVAAVSTGSLISNLRVQLWAEHLQATSPAALAEIRDLSKSLGFWRPTWGTGVTFPHPASALAFVGPGGGTPAELMSEEGPPGRERYGITAMDRHDQHQAVLSDEAAAGSPTAQAEDADGAATAKKMNEYQPDDATTLVIDMGSFDTGITGIRNYKGWKTDASVPHNKRYNGYRTPTDIIQIVLHESSADFGYGFYDAQNETSHLAVQRDATIKQFNDLVECENHTSGLNRTSIGIEFVNRDWLDKEGIPADQTHLTADQKAKYAEASGYFWAFWGDGYNIYKLPPTDLAQLEKEVELLTWLTDTLQATINSAPPQFQSMFPWFEKTWLQLVSYNEIKDKWRFPTANIPAAADQATKNLFVYTTGWDVLHPAQISGKRGIISHNATYTNHPDGSFLALYTWLRMEKGKTGQQAFDLCKSLMKNHWIRVRPKSDSSKQVIVLDVSDHNLV